MTRGSTPTAGMRLSDVRPPGRSSASSRAVRSWPSRPTSRRSPPPFRTNRTGTRDARSWCYSAGAPTSSRSRSRPRPPSTVRTPCGSPGPSRRRRRSRSSRQHGAEAPGLRTIQVSGLLASRLSCIPHYRREQFNI